MATELDKIDLEKFLEEIEENPENRRLLEKFEKLLPKRNSKNAAKPKHCYTATIWWHVFDGIKFRVGLPTSAGFQSSRELYQDSRLNVTASIGGL